MSVSDEERRDANKTGELASKKLKEDYDNGEPYVPFHGTKIYLPNSEYERPSTDQLEWHNNTKYLG